MDSHLLQNSLESNCSGIFFKGSIYLSGSLSLGSTGSVPIMAFTDYSFMVLNLELIPEVQVLGMDLSLSSRDVRS